MNLACLSDKFLAIQKEKSPDRAKFLYIFMAKAQLSGVRASITTVHNRILFKTFQNIVRLRSFLG